VPSVFDKLTYIGNCFALFCSLICKPSQAAFQYRLSVLWFVSELFAVGTVQCTLRDNGFGGAGKEMLGPKLCNLLPENNILYPITDFVPNSTNIDSM
jgi:hypothetical protein